MLGEIILTWNVILGDNLLRPNMLAIQLVVMSYCQLNNLRKLASTRNALQMSTEEKRFLSESILTEFATSVNNSIYFGHIPYFDKKNL